MGPPLVGSVLRRLLGLSLNLSTAALGPTSTRGPAAIARVFSDFADAFNRHDASAAAALFDVDADYIVGHGSDIRGRIAIEEHLAILFTSMSHIHRSVLLQSSRLLRNDVAVLVANYETTGAFGPDGSVIPTTAGVYDWVLSKRQGRWRISLWHEAFLPPSVLPSP